MSILLPSVYTKVTQATVIVPVQDRPDLHEPLTWRRPEQWLTVIPARVQITLTCKEGTSEGTKQWASVSVFGLRRLKSGAEGKEISAGGWEAARIEGQHAFMERPEWLTQLLAENLPYGWDPFLVGLTGSAR